MDSTLSLIVLIILATSTIVIILGHFIQYRFFSFKKYRNL